MIRKYFTPLIIALVLSGVMANFVLVHKNESLKSKLRVNESKIALMQVDNRNLANQLENSQIQLEEYQKQVNDLNDKVLAKITQAEQRSNGILKELEKHKKWADSIVPDSVNRLFNQRNSKISTGNGKSNNVSEKSGMPNAKTQYQY